MLIWSVSRLQSNVRVVHAAESSKTSEDEKNDSSHGESISYPDQEAVSSPPLHPEAVCHSAEGPKDDVYFAAAGHSLTVLCSASGETFVCGGGKDGALGLGEQVDIKYHVEKFVPVPCLKVSTLSFLIYTKTINLRRSLPGVSLP